MVTVLLVFAVETTLKWARLALAGEGKMGSPSWTAELSPNRLMLTVDRALALMGCTPGATGSQSVVKPPPSMLYARRPEPPLTTVKESLPPASFTVTLF